MGDTEAHTVGAPIRRLRTRLQVFPSSIIKNGRIPSSAISHHSSAVVSDVVRQQEEATATRQAKGEAALMALVDKLTPGQRTRFDSRLAIVQGWEVWFVQAEPIRKKAGLDLYARQYNEDDLPALPQITAAVREAYPSISARSVERWHTDYSRDGLAGLIDKQDGHLTRDVNVFTRQPALYNTTLALLVAKPHIKNSDMREMLTHAAVDEETGEILFEVPSIWATDRFLRAWREKHPELLLALVFVDAGRNVWLCTEFGLFRLVIRPSRFQRFLWEKEIPSGFGKRVRGMLVKQVEPSAKGTNLLVNTEMEGFWSLDAKNGRVLARDTARVLHYSIAEDENGDIWRNTEDTVREYLSDGISATGRRFMTPHACWAMFPLNGAVLAETADGMARYTTDGAVELKPVLLAHDQTVNSALRAAVVMHIRRPRG